MKVACCFTGGKDSCLVAHLLSHGLDGGGFIDPDTARRMHPCAGSELALLVTFAPVAGPPFKAHPLELIQLQAKAMRVSHLVMEIPAEPSYLEGYRSAITRLREEHGIQALATGDILDVCSDFMGRATDGILPLLRPLWGMPRRQLLDLLWGNGIEAVISCVNLSKFTAGTGGETGHPASSQNATAASDTAGGNSAGGSAAQTGQGSTGSTTTAAACPALAGATPAVSCDCSLASPSSHQVQLLATAVSVPAAGTAGDATLGPAAAAGTAGDVISSPPAATAVSRLSPSKSLLGRVLSPALHSEVLLGPSCRGLGIDECGEQGEFHTMVVAAPRLFHGQRLILQGEAVSEKQAMQEAATADVAAGLEWACEAGFAFLRVTRPKLVSGSTCKAVHAGL